MKKLIEDEIAKLEREMKKVTDEDEKLKLWKEIGYLEHKKLGRF